MSADPLPTPPPPDPPPAASVAEVEATPLRRLVHHRVEIQHDMRLEDAHRFFGGQAVDFAALVREGRVVGICARSELGFLLGSRFGFALNARSPAMLAAVKRPLLFPEFSPLREVLQAALGRHDDEFYEDIALVDDAQHLVGLVPVEALVRLQTQLVNAQLEEMKRQNLELFAAGHAVRQAQALSAGLFASNVVGVGLLSAAGRLQAGNGRWFDLLGVAPPSAELAVETLLLETDRPAWAELLADLQRGERAHRARDFEVEVPGRGRRTMHFSVGWVAETSQLCICIDDITQQREIERHLHREEKQKMLDTLAGGVAHELNNKLTPVLGYAELLAQNATATQQGYVNFIRKGVQESAHIIRQLLRLAKPEGTTREIVDLAEVVREAVMMLQFQAREVRAELRVETEPGPLLVQGDAAQLKQVVINLGLNALHAMSGVPRPQLHVSAGGTAAGLFFTVRDNGVGIPHEILGRIFDPFFTTKGPDQGTGLGLSICQSIVRQHDGDIKVWSKPGAGTCFTVKLPVLTVRPAVARDPRLLVFTEAAARPAPLRRVLVVEDEEVIRNFLKEALRSLYHCAVDEAGDGREGLARAQEQRYDLILSDIRMPGMTGLEFYEQLREIDPRQAANVVFVTGHMGQGPLRADIERWGVPVLEKPFTLDRLGRVCASCMQADRAAAG